MSKGKNKRKKRGGGRPTSGPEAGIGEVERIAGELAATEDAGPLWGELHRTLMKAGADATQTMRVIAARDLDELGHLIARLKGEEQAVVEAEPEPLPEIDNETKRQAMKTFRRRMKLLRLDRESKLGVGPLTTGKTADVDSMQAPHDFPDEVWRVLVAEGQLKDVGDGFYALP
ncbi:MAG: hypothetical protein QGH76_09040 [Phycisphaerales bacterium]|nr:hypothetical protein [Phycisphaerales bacterium]